MLFPVLLAICAVRASAAEDSIAVPSSIIAGEEFKVTTTVDEASSNLTARYYLLQEGGFISETFAPMCYLSDIVPVSSIPSALTIPKEAGPSRDTYRIKLHIFDDHGHGFDTSNPFALQGTAVDDFSPHEWKGPAREYDSIPCSAMQCNRKCKESAFATQTRGGVEFRGYCQCLVDCPGVTTDNPNYDDGCGWDWRYMKTSSFEAPSTRSTAARTHSTEDLESVVTTGPGSTTSTTAATTSQQTAASNVALPSSTGGVARPIATAHALVALGMLALIP